MRPTRPAPSSLALALLLAGCQVAGGSDGPTAPAADRVTTAGDAAQTAPAGGRPADTVILGEATYRERIKMPPGASLDVELVALDGTAPRVLASARMPDVAGPPIPFSLPYAAGRIAASGRYGLRAVLRGPEGERWFATPAPVPLVPGEGVAVELLLRRTPDHPVAAGAPPAAAGPRHWECGELGLMSRRTADGAVRLDANGRRWTVPAAQGAARAPARTPDVRFDVTGAGATLLVDGEPARDCVPARQPSPWNTALMRGVAFRAVGNEPGWTVEVDGGTSPALRAVLDYGERSFERPVTASPTGVRAGTGADAVELEMRREPCTDGMSGQRFEATAVLRGGGRTYAGCGGWLDD